MNTFLYNPLLILLIMVLYLCIISVYKPAYTKSLISFRHKDLFGIGLIFIFCLFSVQDTDYFHYIDALDSMSRGGLTHFEAIYSDIAEFAGYNNIPFRVIVWGSALTLFILSIKRLEMPINSVLFFFTVLYLLTFSYARVSLAFSMGLYGYTFFVKPIKIKVVSFLFGTSIILSSLFFHKSAIFWIVIFCCSIVKLNKSRFIALLILYPICVFACQKYGLEYLMSSTNEEFVENALNYLDKAKTVHGLNYYVRILLARTPYYIMFFSIIKSVLDGSYLNLQHYEKRIVNVSFYIIYFSSFFLYDLGANTSVMYYRLLYFAILPLSLLMAIFHKYGISKKLMKFSVAFGFMACIYSFLYSFYTATLL